MGENLGEDEANTLLTLIRSNRDDALKVDQLVQAKQKIKHYGIDADATEPTFSAVRIGMSQASNMTLFQHSLSCLGYLVKRCRANDATLLKRLSIDLLPLLLDKMGDAKERIREMALSPVVDIWTVAPVETERAIRENGLTSKNSRLKESSLEWLVRVHALYGGQLSIKPYTSLLVRLLEDASDGVREKAKHVVVDLFKSASGPAKADLQKSITEHQVRKTIATYVIENISGPDMRSSVKNEKDKAKDEKPARPAAKSTYLSSLTGVAMDEMKPAYANTGRELENELNGMLTDLSGKESEQNWAARERHVTRIRELLRGNAPTDHPAIFSAGIKTLCDGLVNVVKSLRTTVSTKGCQCVKDLFLVLGHGMDPTVDIILPTMIKLCGGTKKITAEAANVTCAVIFAKTSYHHKIPNYLYGACTDKNIQPRLYATSWFRALVEAHAHEKYILDHGDGIKKLEDGLKKVLVDSNPAVREGGRAAFWTYFDLFPDRATVILEAQDANTRKLLDKDNPNGSSGTSAGPSSNAGPSSRPAAARAGASTTTRLSIKEQIAARRKEAAAAAQAKQAPKLEPAHSLSGPLSAGSSSSAQTAPEKSGISSAPVRPSRPMRPKSQLSIRVDEAKRPASSSSNGDSANAIERTLERMNGNRAMSPSSSARSGFSPSTSSYKKSSTTSPPGSTRAARTTVRASPLSSRKLTILEQLAHADHKVRLEGIVVLGCALAGRTPPNYEKRPPVPPSDQLAPALQKLLNDPHTEVVESVLAPEVLPELVKFVGYDQIVPRVLLLNEVDETEHPRPYPTKSLASLKELLTPAESAELLFKVITSMGSGGAMSRKMLPGAMSFTSVQRKRILHGALEWMNTLAGGDKVKPNDYIDQPDTYKLFINRLVPMVPSTKQPNFTPLASILKNIQKRNPTIFDRILATFDPAIQRDLKKAWGMKDESEGASKIEEEVARVEKVLGIIPSVNEMPPPPRPNRGIDIPDVSHKTDFITEDEELTMINPMSALANLNIVPSAAPSTIPTAADTRKSSSGSLDIPDFLSTTKKTTANGTISASNRDKDLIQVYQDPTPPKPGVNVPRSPEPLANITNSVRPRIKNFGASTTAGKTPEQQLQSLQNYLRKLKDGDIDSHGLRRLCAIVRDNPAKREQQENKDAIDFWAGGQTFEEMLDSLLDFLGEPFTGGSTKTPEALADVRTQGIQLLRLLMNKATPYFTGREHSVLPVAFKLRGEYPTQSPVSTNIDDTVEDYVKSVADSGIALPTITSFLMMTTPDAGAGAGGTGKKKVGSNVLALKTLAAFVKESDEEDLESQWNAIGAIAKRYMEDEDPEVRRAVVEVCVGVRKGFVKNGDVEEGEARLWKECLEGLTEGQKNLLTYYFARNN
ncbi:suppressor of tub2 mutation [Orbilia oligospora]|uniref:Suppressor of tub2 mutation n=2 Tax=Orbilia oligospora TaxID=2813651 RepID=A0A7C8TSD7_ORBOL|nr:suppressor of tub2 mutation [Orbilia oligospora]TGJ64480.1 suppressor of tub2 mutation [Orbilia oligospora]